MHGVPVLVPVKKIQTHIYLGNIINKTSNMHLRRMETSKLERKS